MLIRENKVIEMHYKDVQRTTPIKYDMYQCVYVIQSYQSGPKASLVQCNSTIQEKGKLCLLYCHPSQLKLYRHT